ncbi:MAG: ketoacyl-ACP synthase III [Oscillospiraceae bacterium]|jgi:3-oxoacyl-[acyl-carrier-protein] synthase-3|nr:ketoacyl-ACP synthase III [Oscillospiraceae bacterium]
MGLKIIGTGKGIPETRISNDDLAAFLETDDEWIVSRTGIKNRHVCTHETLTDLSVKAAMQAIEKSGLAPDDIELIICATIGGDFRTPALACCVLERIGAKCPAFDINAACAGFIYSLEVASGFLDAGKAKNVLIVCAEMMSMHMDWNDRNTCVLFGDGASACVVAGGNALRFSRLSAIADVSVLNLPSGTGNSPFIDNKRENGFLRMQGQEVFRFAVCVVESEIKQALGALNISEQQIDWFILHQANKRIIESVRMKLLQPEMKFPINIDRYGNVSSASIPLLLDEMLEEGKIKNGDTLFMTAFGAGLTVGTCVMVWE